jgi:sialate O-acetylesterase
MVARKEVEFMISKYVRLAAATIVILFAISGSALAQNTPGMPPMLPQPPKTLPFVSTLFGDNMVLQRGKANTIWGWSEPGDKVKVQIGETVATGVAGADRRWQVNIQPPPVGGPYTVKITGHESVELHNVMVGDVWLCGGQSNMELPLRMTLNGADESKSANYPNIRFFTVTGHPAYHHTDVVGGKWSEVTPQTADWVSAVAYYFARRVQQDIHVPIGLLLDNLGGWPG